MIINGRFLKRKITGVERYAREVTRRLPASVRLVSPRSHLAGWKGHFWEQVVLPRRVGKDWLWSPANTGPLWVDRQVVTIHDAFPLDHPEWFQASFAAWYRVLLSRLAQRARVILTVSAYSRNRLINLLGLPAKKVIVAPGGVDQSWFHPFAEGEKQQFRKAWGLPPTYLLFLGPSDPRKNLKGLIRAWELVREDHPGVELVIAGKSAEPCLSQPWHPGGRVRHLGYVEESCLPALYAAATALVLPSLAEGFGLPALEAMACGAPVLAGYSGALPEVAGDAALWVDPQQPEEIAGGIDALLSSSGLRQALVQRGFSRVQKYPWERTAAIVQQVFREVPAKG